MWTLAAHLIIEIYTRKLKSESGKQNHISSLTFAVDISFFSQEKVDQLLSVLQAYSDHQRGPSRPILKKFK